MKIRLPGSNIVKSWNKFLVAISIVFFVVSAIANFDQLRSETSISLLVGLTTISILVVFVGFLFLERMSENFRESYREKERREKEAKVVAEFEKLLSGAGDRLGQFLFKTLMRKDQSIQSLRAFNSQHALLSFTKNCTVSGGNLKTSEELQGENKGDRHATKLKRVSLGGNPTSFEDLRKTIKVTWISNGTETDISANVSAVAPSEQDQLKVVDVTFLRPVDPDGSFHIRYEHEWRDAMLSGLDAIFFPEAVFYGRGIQEMRSELAFDSELTHIGAYWYDFDTSECGTSSRQPRPREGNAKKYDWSIKFPSNTRVYFIMFVRISDGSGA